MMNTRPTDGIGRQQADVPGAALPVIAVFGGPKDEDSERREATLDAAEQVGYEIGLSHAILLTGGDDPTAKDLKGRVLFGAHVRARNGGATAPWIGVVRKDKALNPERAADGLSLVLTPGGDHLRNYAEAELCDAAIAFEGGDGTSSEVAFCLALGKPLVLVGEPWLSKYPVVSAADKRDELKTAAQRRVPPPPEQLRLGPPIIKAYEMFDRIVDPSFQHFPLPPEAPASAVVETAVILADRASSLGGDERAAIRQFRTSCEQRDNQ